MAMVINVNLQSTSLHSASVFYFIGNYGNGDIMFPAVTSFRSTSMYISRQIVVECIAPILYTQLKYICVSVQLINIYSLLLDVQWVLLRWILLYASQYVIHQSNWQPGFSVLLFDGKRSLPTNLTPNQNCICYSLTTEMRERERFGTLRFYLLRFILNVLIEILCIICIQIIIGLEISVS